MFTLRTLMQTANNISWLEVKVLLQTHKQNPIKLLKSGKASILLLSHISEMRKNFLLVTRQLLLVTRYYFLVYFYWLLVGSYLLLVTFYSLLVTTYLLLFTWLFIVTTYSLLLILFYSLFLFINFYYC